MLDFYNVFHCFQLYVQLIIGGGCEHITPTLAFLSDFKSKHLLVLPKYFYQRTSADICSCLHVTKAFYIHYLHNASLQCGILRGALTL